MLHRWNQIAIDASGLDHTPFPHGDTKKNKNLLDPGARARAMAIVHIAMFDSLVGSGWSLQGVTPEWTAPNGPMSTDAAISSSRPRYVSGSLPVTSIFVPIHFWLPIWLR